MPSVHPWKLVFGGASYVVGFKMDNSLIVGEKLKKEYFQDLLISIGYFEGMKFTWVGMMIRYKLENDRKTDFGRISKKYECADLNKALDSRILLIADQNDVDMLMDFFKIATLDSLIDAGKKYKVKESAIEALRKERAKLGNIPDWIPEMEDNPEIMLEMYRNSVPKTMS